jgi:hypothetical protein
MTRIMAVPADSVRGTGTGGALARRRHAGGVPRRRAPGRFQVPMGLPAGPTVPPGPARARRGSPTAASTVTVA